MLALWRRYAGRRMRISVSARSANPPAKNAKARLRIEPPAYESQARPTEAKKQKALSAIRFIVLSRYAEGGRAAHAAHL